MNHKENKVQHVQLPFPQKTPILVFYHLPILLDWLATKFNLGEPFQLQLGD